MQESADKMSKHDDNDRTESDQDSSGIHLSKKKKGCLGGCLFLVGLFLAFVIFTVAFMGPVASWIWYRSMGLSQIFTTNTAIWLKLFGGTVLAVFAACFVSLFVASRFSARGKNKFDAADDAQKAADASSKALVKKGAADDDYYSQYRGYRSSSYSRYDRSDDGEYLFSRIVSSRWIWAIMAGLVALFALWAGLITANHWQMALLWQNQVQAVDAKGVAITDPNFGLNISYFLFTLPAQYQILKFVGGLLEYTFIVTALWYTLMIWTAGAKRVRPAVIHLALIAAARLALGAGGFILDRLALSWSQNGWITGVSASDTNVRLGAYPFLAVVAILFAIGLLVAAVLIDWNAVWANMYKADDWWSEQFAKHRRRSVGLTTLASAALIIPLLMPAGVGVYGALNQSTVVGPNEQIAEAPYIANNIAMTRLGFGLTSWSLQPYPATSPLTQADLTADQATLANARLWDYRPLQDTLDQLQTVRQYYEFNDVDIDRYTINGAEQQVMLSARELNPANNPAGQNFINNHIVYTHGFGVAMVPTNAVTDGKPDLIIKDIPVTSSGGAPVVTQPRIYFGTGAGSNDWVLVGARSDEFDSPDTATPTNWSGDTGINISSLPTKLFWSMDLGSLDLLLTNQVTSSTDLMLHRNISDRLHLAAPFLTWDADPYLVITSSGKLVWVVDGYTTSSHMPDASSYSPDSSSGLAGVGDFNYVRNSVKATVDAYSGAINLYENDGTDPIIKTWENVYPGLIQPLSAMPADIAAHLRAPEDMFNAQVAQYARYHVTDTSTFYKSSDVWTTPQANASSSGNASTQNLPTQAYYTEMKLPGDTNPEYVLIQPMVPKGRPNMIAWVGVRNDTPNRGQAVIYQLSESTSIVGPAQIESNIDTNGVISGQISLWEGSGSKVVRGNLLVIPVGNTFLYVEPLYLQSTSGTAYPKFTKVIVATSEGVQWGDNLGQALNNLLTNPNPTGSGSGNSPTPSATPSAPPSISPTVGPVITPAPLPSGLPTDIKGLIAYANDHYAAAQLDLKNGDAGGYNVEMLRVQQALTALAALEGLGTPTP